MGAEMTQETENVTLEVDRTACDRTRLLTEPPAALESGQVRWRIDRFALTANNVTYAVMGDFLGYWDFFPAAAGWGRVPAMGWAEVVESAHPDVRTGERYYGWFPMARQVAMDVSPTDSGLRDDGAHRQAHAEVYRGYVRTDQDPWYEAGEDAEDRHALLRGLFLTGFLIDEHFADVDYHGASSAVVLSASSKTAIGYAQRAATREGLSLVGVTSDSNRAFVESLGCYSRVVSYDEVASLPVTDAVLVDMSGDAATMGAVHARFGDRLRESLIVGRSHHDAPPAAVEGGPDPQLFFAPTEILARMERWGAEGYRDRTTSALRHFVEASRDWLTIDRRTGADAVESAWGELVAGQVPPDQGLIASLHD
jgi:hypothetical protein